MLAERLLDDLRRLWWHHLASCGHHSGAPSFQETALRIHGPPIWKRGGSFSSNHTVSRAQRILVPARHYSYQHRLTVDAQRSYNVDEIIPLLIDREVKVSNKLKRVLRQQDPAAWLRETLTVMER